MAKFSYDETIKKLRSTPKGKEASMYGPIRDIFIQLLGYSAADVDIDTIGEGGRPDVTARAPSGLLDSKGNALKIDWLVVEAKDENHCFTVATSRENIFEQKSKYITAHTAWFIMVEPDAWVLRPVAGNNLTSDADIIIDLTHDDVHEFIRKTESLHVNKAGVSHQLAKFREGDLRMIAVEKLSAPLGSQPTKRALNRIKLNRKRFFQQVREATSYLQSAVSGAFSRLEPEIKHYQETANLFWEEFGRNGDDFDQHTLAIHGKPNGPEQCRRHDRESSRLKREFSKSPHVARLALSGLPDFQSRTGAEDKNLHELFAIETANLILARVLLLRFFEDHEFFGDTRYVCNGGVAAFQNMRSYFKASYAKLLEQAYQQGSRLYASAFDETELDWIFGASDENLSNAIEWTLFSFARYDFKTVKGDILTGIYDRFMDRSQRKKLGEFYTPPSIARYIIRRMGVNRNSKVIDPSCGSGTFLIECYIAMVGHDVERGAAEYSDVLDVFGNISGNDLNTFSAVLAQIQLLWQILSFKDEIETQGFPDVLITAKVNSLVERDQWTSLDRFAEIDVPEYDAVIGNPPYVRAERSAQALDSRSQKEFERGRLGFEGISSKLNAYALFLYRALDRWCKPVDEHGNAGKVGFVLPVSLFDSNDTESLRSLFEIGGRWAIREIVDLEIIWRNVFDAKAITAVIIVENRPATEDDLVSIRFADQACIKHVDKDALPEFDLLGLPEANVPYSDLFSPDGRILTRLTSTRLDIIRKLWTNQTFAEVAKPYWVKRNGNKITDWTDVDPNIPALWEVKRMIAGGIAFRGSKPQCSNGMDVYKGENIIAAELQGDVALNDVDMSQVDDSSLWKYSNILPSRGLAVAGVAHCPNAVLFNPAKIAFTNTATIMFPRDELAHVPYDLLLISNVYVWFYAIGARMGVLDTVRSHIYPTNLAYLPWNQAIGIRSAEIEAMRTSLVQACTSRLAAAESLAISLDNLKLSTLKQRLKEDLSASISWGDNFSDTKYECLIENITVTQINENFRVALSPDLFDYIECNNQDIANGLSIALIQVIGKDKTKSSLLNLPIPITPKELAEWQRLVDVHQEDVLEKAMNDVLNDLDQIVGQCLGLNVNDISEIQRDLKNDSFLKGVRPRYPGTVTRKQGFRTGLDLEDRYE